jgi:hypothetical protein
MMLVSSQVHGLQNYLLSVSQKIIPLVFLDQALKNWELLGPHKAKSVFYNIDSFHVEQPG